MFYVMNEVGRRMAGGREFETLELAEQAAQRSVRIRAGRSTHGWGPFDVMEAIPGRHRTRSTVYPDRIERRKEG